MRTLLIHATLVLALLAVASAGDTPPAAVPPAPSTTTIAVLANGFTLEFDHRQVRDNITRLFLTSAGDSYVDVATDQITNLQPGPPRVAPVAAPQPAPPPTIDQILTQAGDKHALDADFLRSVIRAESGFNARAVSPKGAQGLMQLMPGTASSLGVKNSFDPAANVDGGARYLRELLQRYHGDVAKALAAYNAGPQRVDRFRGVPPYGETRAYVTRIIRDFNRQKLAPRTKPAASVHPRPASSSP